MILQKTLSTRSLKDAQVEELIASKTKMMELQLKKQIGIP